MSGRSNEKGRAAEGRKGEEEKGEKEGNCGSLIFCVHSMTSFPRRGMRREKGRGTFANVCK
eukprot:746229-Hanusia_phi.AAC.5